MLSFRALSATDFPLMLAWLSSDHVKQWWDDGDDTLEKVALHYGAEEPDVARFILIKSTEAEERPIGYFQYYIVSQETIGIDQFIGEADHINQGIGTTAIRLFLERIVMRHKPQQVIIDPHPENQRAIRCYEKVGFVYYAIEKKESGESAYMMRLNCRIEPANNPPTHRPYKGY
jgi:aminoglycoside 6'-N-acetyltransferase